MEPTPAKKFLPLERFKWKKIVQYFLQGLLLIAPLAITIYAIYWVVSTVDSWVPIFREPIRDVDGRILRYEVKNYGLGFLLILATVVLIGYLSSFFIQSHVCPGIQTFY